MDGRLLEKWFVYDEASVFTINFFLFYISSAAISHVMLSYPFGVLGNLYIIYLYILFILCYVYGNVR